MITPRVKPLGILSCELCLPVPAKTELKERRAQPVPAPPPAGRAAEGHLEGPSAVATGHERLKLRHQLRRAVRERQVLRGAPSAAHLSAARDLCCRPPGPLLQRSAHLPRAHCPPCTRHRPEEQAT